MNIPKSHYATTTTTARRAALVERTNSDEKELHTMHKSLTTATMPMPTSPTKKPPATGTGGSYVHSRNGGGWKSSNSRADSPETVSTASLSSSSFESSSSSSLSSSSSTLAGGGAFHTPPYSPFAVAKQMQQRYSNGTTRRASLDLQSSTGPSSASSRAAFTTSTTTPLSPVKQKIASFSQRRASVGCLQPQQPLQEPSWKSPNRGLKKTVVFASPTPNNAAPVVDDEEAEEESIIIQSPPPTTTKKITTTTTAAQAGGTNSPRCRHVVTTVTTTTTTTRRVARHRRASLDSAIATPVPVILSDLGQIQRKRAQANRTAAATKIQARFRGRRLRRLATRCWAAVRLQAMARGFIVRRLRLPEMKLHAYARKLQQQLERTRLQHERDLQRVVKNQQREMKRIQNLAQRNQDEAAACLQEQHAHTVDNAASIRRIKQDNKKMRLENQTIQRACLELAQHNGQQCMLAKETYKNIQTLQSVIARLESDVEGGRAVERAWQERIHEVTTLGLERINEHILVEESIGNKVQRSIKKILVEIHNNLKQNDNDDEDDGLRSALLRDTTKVLKKIAKSKKAASAASSSSSS